MLFFWPEASFLTMLPAKVALNEGKAGEANP
jgi:hypothetical protein